MTKMQLTLLALTFVAFLTGCGNGQMEPSREVRVDGQFSVNVPKNLLPCNDLHEFAQLQLADDRSGFYVLGIMEPKAALANLPDKYELGDYTDFVESTIADAFDTVHVTMRDTLEINGLQCQTIDFYAAVTSEQAPLEVYYHLSVFESKSHFYQLIGWTHRDRQETFAEAAHDMEHSFHEFAGVIAQQAEKARP